jgi:dTDP-4-dehydrorhamnose 3,5-epimerase
MKVEPRDIPGIVVIEPQVFEDARGYFLETWSRERYAGVGVPESFVQDNVSRSIRNTVRGLHLQHPHGQGKLVQVLEGEVFDVIVDVRVGSPAFGRWVATTLSGRNHRQIYIPPGLAHGFCVTADAALFAYKCTEPYHPESELGIAWNDPDLAIPWPAAAPLLSPRDAGFPLLRDIPRERLPRIPDEH